MATDSDAPVTPATTSTTPTALSAVHLKLPPYWPSDPEVWFAQVEAQFTTRGITAQKTKFDHIVASLSSEIATEVRDLIRRLQQLFNTEELGDRKPTQLLRRMQQLLGDKAASTDSSFLRGLFLQRMPGNIRMVLASTADSVSLEELAALADKVMDVAAPSIAAVSTPQATTDMEQLRAEVTRLKEAVTSLTKSRRSGRSPSPHPSTDSTLCWYHQRFGKDARKCRPPCSWSGNDSASR